MTKITAYNSNQIGGNVVVIETEKSKIAIDFGENLPGNENANTEIEGLSTGERSFDAVFFTHYHGDHVGRIQSILPGVELYLGTVARQILLNINTTLKNDDMVKLLSDDKRIKELHKDVTIPINQGDILVTPYIVDHSAYEAFMLLIETKDKTILHTGDFREHGYRGGKSLIPTIDCYVRQNGKRNVDTLIIEGTMLSRMNEKVFTEDDLQAWAEDYFKEHRHIFLLCSSTNLDTLASFYQAGDKYGMRMFGTDYVVTQLKTFSGTAGNETTHYKFENVWPIRFGKMLNKGSFHGTQEEYMRRFGFICVVKEGEAYEKWIERFKDCKPVLIYSMWEGYLDPKRPAYNRKLAEFYNKYKHVIQHTSGHATAEAIAKVITAVDPKQEIIPIHTENADALKSLNISDELKQRIVFI